MEFIQRAILNFLSHRGLTVRNASIFQGYSFKPGSSVKYLGFKFIFPNSKVSLIDRGVYTRKIYSPLLTGYTNLIKCAQRRLLLIIEPVYMKQIKNKIKLLLSSKYVCLPVARMIANINLILSKFLNYFNITVDTNKQVACLNNLIHVLFYKYLLRKFSSTPKIYSTIIRNFKHRGSFRVKGQVLLKTYQVKSNYFNLLNSIVFSSIKLT